MKQKIKTGILMTALAVGSLHIVNRCAQAFATVKNLLDKHKGAFYDWRCGIGGIAFEPRLFIRFGGTVGPFPYESGVVSLFKLVRAEIVQQVQTVIGKVGLTLVFLLVVHYFGFSGLIINGIIGWKKEEKGTRYPSECHH